MLEATKHDIDDLVQMMAATTLERYKLIPDRKKIRKIVDMTFTSNSHQIFVTKTGEQIDGYLVMGSTHSDIAKKMIGNILYFDFGSADIARALIRNAMEWIEARRGVQLVYYSVPFTSQATDILLEYGFRKSDSMIYWRRKWVSSQKHGKA